MCCIRWWLAFLMCFGLAASGAYADGKAFVLRAQDPGSVRMPDQQALISFDNGVQTLAIETRFESSGSNFAWVVPLPAVPTVEAATQGLFPTLQALFQPKVIEREPVALGALVPLILATLIVIAVPRWKGMLLALLLVLVAAVTLLPALGKARASVRPTSTGVEVLARTIAGEFELTTISSDDPAALMNWLNDGGYAVPGGAASVIADYVARGWVFVAAKAVAPEAIERRAVTPRPLVFRFPVDAPVYPMRLTGVENGGPLELELFVFGPASAQVAGMEATTSLMAYRDDPAWNTRSWPKWGEIGVSHAGLQEVLAPSLTPNTPMWATKLRGTLEPAQMQTDLAITFGARSGFREEVYTPKGRRAMAMTSAGAVMLLGLFLAFLGFEASRAGAKARWIGVAVVMLTGAAGGLVHGAMLPVTDGAQRVARYDGQWLWEVMQQELDPLPAAKEGEEIDRLREAMAGAIRRLESEGWMTEGVRDGLREGDGPGQYGFRVEADGNWSLVWHDWFGAEMQFLFVLPE